MKTASHLACAVIKIKMSEECCILVGWKTALAVGFGLTAFAGIAAATYKVLTWKEKGREIVPKREEYLKPTETANTETALSSRGRVDAFGERDLPKAS